MRRAEEGIMGWCKGLWLIQVRARTQAPMDLGPGRDLGLRGLGCVCQRDWDWDWDWNGSVIMIIRCCLRMIKREAERDTGHIKGLAVARLRT